MEQIISDDGSGEWMKQPFFRWVSSMIKWPENFNPMQARDFREFWGNVD